MAGEQVDEMELPAEIFNAPINTALMHQAFVRQMANARLGTHKTQSRGEVNRTKSKWYRQKGTGRARHGSRNAPIFVGGGIAHGPKPRSYRKKMPRKMRRAALRSALSAKAAESQIVLVDELQMEEPKTRDFADFLTKIGATDDTLVLLADGNVNVERSARNIQNVKLLRANYLNIRDLLGCETVLIPLDSLKVIQAILE
jgi:large subunit ribosomal protein L4